MKVMFNFTTSGDDLDRYDSVEALVADLEGFDGLELMVLEDDERGLVPKDRVVGVHLGYFVTWLDFWEGNERALVEEFGSLQACESYYGALDRGAIVRRYKGDMGNAHKYGAEYVVFHCSEALLEETFTFKYRRSDEEVVDALCEILNAVFAEEDGSVALLLENLWQPGLTFTRPEITKRLLDGVKYENKGIMLDTGHLFHMDFSIRTQEEGLAYINRMLDEHGALCEFVRGIHLNQSLTGEYCQRLAGQPFSLPDDYDSKWQRVFEHAFAADQHKPFTCDGVKGLVDRIAPEYLTFEFISASREEHLGYLFEQRRALGM